MREKYASAPIKKLRKLIREEAEPEVVARLVEQHMGSCSRLDLVDELAECALVLRDYYKQGSIASKLPISELLAGLKSLVQKKDLKPEEFYPAIMERLILEGESCDNPRAGTKRSTKEKILNAALDLFYEKGFHLATVDDIAERAGVGKGTLYRYFANKGALFNEIIASRLGELEREAQTVLDGHDDVLTMISKYIHVYFTFFDHNKRLYRLILQERLDLADQVQELYVKKVMKRIPVLKRKIREAGRAGVLKDVDFQTAFFGVMGFIHGVIQKWLVQDCSYPLVNELPTVVEVLFYGFVKNKHQHQLRTQEE